MAYFKSDRCVRRDLRTISKKSDSMVRSWTWWKKSDYVVNPTKIATIYFVDDNVLEIHEYG
jgi:hypothetical protein